ncbi:alkaline phosphatase [Pontibacter diazotrophicus]|uniref:Alkaline phosphatase n=1 Tax=Pontibacter diazotrophicus TaxID=1400979 RepID=A0A3D8LDT9_9BACT|nr:alkaline phosphatase D family protein [Pontibacter diazotrophicus]RDV15601.1 alkaline phosphatase [Pontibacter diazotrophicus]
MDKQQILKKLSRRNFIRNSVIAATGVTLLPSVLTSCNVDEDYIPSKDFGFFEGVASFDPTQERVVLWTRYTPAPHESGKPEILLDVATDQAFNEVLVSQSVEVDTISDNTVNVDVSNLTSNTKYYYRFRNESNGAISIVGETRTLPAAGEATEVKMAVVSCANYQSGLFNVYGAVAESDADVVVHLGDYIYEYGLGGYGTNTLTVALDRIHHPKDEIITIDDYRARYRQYRRDEQLQKAHQLKPFICVWDDHEIANNAYENGAQNHQPGEGDFETRKLNAIQAWHEYLPARVEDNAKIYRNFEIAGIVNLMMLDTRIVGRDRQLNYNDYLTPNGLDAAAFLTDWQTPNRTILGSEQRSWLMSTLRTSSATWQVLGNQVLMGKMFLPAELLLVVSQIAAGNASPELFAQLTALITQLVSIKVRIRQGDTTVSDAERARVETVLPYNLDAWDGYPVEREMIYAVAAGKKLISLAGDTHNAWYSDLSAASGNKVGAEFAASSVSSPGIELIFGNNAEVLDGVEQAFTTLIDDLHYLNASDRGYVMATFSNSEAQADWRFVRTLAAKNTTTTTDYTASEG